MQDFTEMKTAQLVATYNEMAKKLDRPAVAKFQDRPTAIKRCQALSEAIGLPDGTFSTRQAAISDARVKLGSHALTMVHFNLHGSATDGWTWEAIDNSPAPHTQPKAQPQAPDAASQVPATQKKAQKMKTDPKTAELVVGGHNFGPVRLGSNREKLIKALMAGKGAPQSSAKLIKAVYGPDANADAMKGALQMVVNGIIVVNIKKQNLPLKVVRTRQDKETHFALVAAD